MFWPPLHKRIIVSWKLCLNLCFLKWLRPSLSLVIKLNSFKTVKIEKKIWERLYEIKYFFLKEWNTLRGSKTKVWVIRFNNSKREKRIFEKVMLCLNKGKIDHSSCSIWYTFYWNEIKKTFWMFIFENSMKETNFSVTNSKLNSLKV